MRKSDKAILIPVQSLLRVMYPIRTTVLRLVDDIIDRSLQTVSEDDRC